jgi:hypothetical protein
VVAAGGTVAIHAARAGAAELRVREVLFLPFGDAQWRLAEQLRRAGC